MPMSYSTYVELTRPFLLKEHGLKPQRENDPGGQPYLLKTALERRLYRVAPGWSMGQPVLISITGDVIVMSGSMTIEGQTHGALGTGIIRHSTNGNAAQDAQFVATAFKSASSDILPRCAVLFGIGWYLKSIPADLKKRVVTWDGLRDYLALVQSSWESANADVLRAVEKIAEAGQQKERRIS